MPTVSSPPNRGPLGAAAGSDFEELERFRAETQLDHSSAAAGYPEETEAHIDEAMRLSPRDTLAYLWMTNVGIAKNQVGNWKQAVR